jgi:putative inorganic carbon (HCO3(-)) transporter
MKKHIDLLSIGVLLLLGPFFVFPKEKWNWMLLTVVIMLFFSRWIIERRFLPNTPIDAAIGVLLVMALASVFVIKDIGESAGKLAGLIYGIVVFYALTKAITTPGRVKVAILVFLAAGCVLAVVGLLGRIEYKEPFFAPVESKLPKIPKIKLGLTGAETGVNLNPLGGILLLFIPIGIMQFPLLVKVNKDYAAPSVRRVGFVVTVAILGVQALAVLLSISFGTWFALALALWLMGEWKRPIKTIIVGVSLTIFVFFFLNTSRQVNNKNPGIRDAINSSIENRVDLWKKGLEIAKTHPVFGIGMDQLRRTPKYLYGDSHAHNQFLHTAAELGIPGLIAYLAILIGVFWIAGEVRRSALPEWMRLTSRGLGTGIFAFTLFGMGDAIPLGAKPGIFFWMSLAMITSIYLYGRNNGFMKKSEKRSN